MASKRFLRPAIAALTLSIATASMTVPAAGAATDFKSMINQHNAQVDRWDEMTGKENAALVFTGTRTKTVKKSVYGCPIGKWTFKGATNFDATRGGGGVGFADRLQAKVSENRIACIASIDAIVAAAEKESWSPAMEALEDGPEAITGMRQGEQAITERVAPELVAQKRREYVDALATSKWSTETERKAAVVRPYAGDAAVNRALADSRRNALNGLAADDSEWTPAWAARFDEIKKVLPKETQAVIDARFKRLVDAFAADGKPWSLAWEQQVAKATAGATANQRKVANEMVGKRRQAAADAFAKDGQAWSPAWEAKLKDLRSVAPSLADKVIGDRRAGAARGFEQDGKSWSPEWDRTIEPLAKVSGDAAKVRSDRRAAYVRDITTNRPWNEVSDRIFQGFLEDSAARRVVLDQSTISLIETWRGRAVEGLSANRKWSPELEEEFAYLTVTYPKAKEQMKKLRAEAGKSASDDIKANGWSLEQDSVLAQLADYDYATFGPTLDSVRKTALNTLRKQVWSVDSDKALSDLASVYPMARDAVEQERAEAFSAITLPKQWNENVDAQLAPLAEVGFEPAAQALESLRSEHLARLEIAPATAERDIELAKLAEVYAPAQKVIDAGTLPPVTSDSSGSAPTDDASQGESQDENSEDESNTEEETDGGLDSDGQQDDSSSMSSSEEDGEETSPADVKEIIGIIVAVIGALGTVMGVLAPFLSKMNIPGLRL